MAATKKKTQREPTRAKSLPNRRRGLEAKRSVSASRRCDYEGVEGGGEEGRGWREEAVGEPEGGGRGAEGGKGGGGLSLCVLKTCFFL